MAGRIEELLAQSEQRSLLRLSTAGSVDDGKSTLIGRLLHDCKAVYDDHLEGIRGRSKQSGKDGIDLSLLTDGLKAEREQSITIDVAYRYFSTPKRHFILADTPGHVQYTRNMATGASTSSLAILLVDARNGISEQTKRHAFISSLLGVPRIVVAVNKMDVIDWSESAFDNIRQNFAAFAGKLGIRDVTFIPVSALLGDNVVHPGKHMPWYTGPTLLSHLENVYVDSDRNMIDFRFPVQYVIRPNQNFRGFAGKIVSGSVKSGDEIVILPSRKQSKIKSIETFSGQVESASSPQSVTLTLDHEIDISRGDMIVRVNNVPEMKSDFEAILIWMDESEAEPGRQYRLLHCNRDVRARIQSIRYTIDVNDLSRKNKQSLSLNSIGRVEIQCQSPLFVDSYQRNRATGNFILVDEITNATVAAGMILDRHTASSLHTPEKGSGGKLPTRHISNEKSTISVEERIQRVGHRAFTIWFTGLSGSGKSTVGRELERRLFDQRIIGKVLDGDNLRAGLNSDLGFSAEERAENIRRTAEVAKILNDAGLVVICTLISPLARDRQAARSIIGEDRFCEIYMATPLAVCEGRDAKGLYKKARSGEIPDFTGVSAPYEPPQKPALVLSAETVSVSDCVKSVLEEIIPRLRTANLKNPH